MTRICYFFMLLFKTRNIRPGCYKWFIFISCRSFHKSKSCTSNRRNHYNSYI